MKFMCKKIKKNWITIEEGFIINHNPHKWNYLIEDFKRQCITCLEIQIKKQPKMKKEGIQYLQGGFPIKY